MSFRQRVTLLVAVAIAVTVAAASGVVWFVSKHELYKQLDQTLLVQAQNGGGPFGGNTYTRTIHPDGDVTGNPAIPATPAVPATRAEPATPATPANAATPDPLSPDATATTKANKAKPKTK